METKTFKYLRNEGRKVFNGLDMFIYQGQKSFYLWNKINPEIDDELVELLNSKLMIKIGITGSLASGKTTASKILSFEEDSLVLIRL